VIERYTRAEMANVWSDESRWASLLEVEKAVARVQARMRIIPQKASAKIQAVNKLSSANIKKREQITKHDVIAFVQEVADKAQDAGRYVHFGLTSSDVLDTAMSLQIKRSWSIFSAELLKLGRQLSSMSKKYKDVACAGRTHGMHAEPTTFGFKLAGYLSEWIRQYTRLEVAFEEASTGKLSGAVGCYSNLPAELETKVCKELGLKPEWIATQVIPRDRHAQLFSALAVYGGFIERLSVELRHLQRSELQEVTEGFSKGQKGSSAMPHKKNPISAENLTGISRLLRGYALSALENQALWHERDISHSSVERVILPDGMILVHYATARLRELLESLKINDSKMAENMSLSRGMLMSSRLLVEMVSKGLTREEAYEHVQSLSHNLGRDQSLSDACLEDPVMRELFSRQELAKIFAPSKASATVKEKIQFVCKKFDEISRSHRRGNK